MAVRPQLTVLFLGKVSASRFSNRYLRYYSTSEYSAASLRFINVRFTVDYGASLVFDMPTTQFGPNDGVREALGENATS